jgi:hypothetical protein
MFINSVQNFEIYRFQNDKSNKIWGCFQTNDDVWINFWGAWKANASFKNHGKHQYTVDAVRRKKIREGYKRVQQQDVLTEWSEFETMMLERFTWFKLSQSVEKN